MLGIQRHFTAAVRSVVADWQREGKLEGLAAQERLAGTLIKTIETQLLKDS
jgi:hypothetical protein